MMGTHGISTTRLDAAFGVELHGIDTAAPLTPEARQAVIDAYHKHQLVLLRGRPLEPRPFLDLIRNFGDPDPSRPQHEPVDVDGFIGLRLVSNIEEGGKAKGQFGHAEMGWHQDRWTDAAPPPATVLHGVEIPPHGGATGFANLCEAYDQLPPALRGRIEGRTIHFPLIVTDREGRLKDADPSDPSLFRIVPLVQTHAVTGRRFLFLGARRILSYIDTSPRISGLTQAEGMALLDDIYAHVSSPAFEYRHEWTPGDLVMFDNRCCAHRREAFDNSQRRLLYAMPLLTSDVLWVAPAQPLAA
jgi:taurine dioxygenase